MERETGIEPALVAWKATVLPLNYSRPGDHLPRLENRADLRHEFVKPKIEAKNQNFVGGGRWIRTTEGMSQQIYSLPPLAAWVSLRTEPPIVCSGGVGCQGGMERAKEPAASDFVRERA
jgi:hypothetical protein